MRRGILCSVLAMLVLAPSALVLAQDNGMTTGGNIRIRTEYKSPFNYFDTDGGEATSDDGTFMRTQLHFGWEVANDIAVKVQLQDSRFWGGDSVGDSADADVDVRQAYLSLNNLQNMESLSFLGENDVDLHVGRIALPTVGDGYIVARNDWSNTGPTAWDGFWLDSTFGSFDVDFLWADLQNTDPNGTGGAIGAAEGSTFWFLQAGSRDFDWVGGDVYVSTYKGDFTAGGFTDVDMMTYGVRLVSNIPEDVLEGLDVVFEYAMQSGDSGANDIDADFMLIRASYALDIEDLNPVFGIGLSAASGDGDGTTNGDVETWMQPLQYRHGLLGHYDLVANSNVEDLFITSQVTLMDAFDVHLDIHFLTLDEEADGWYTQSAGQQAGATDDDLGTEIDLYATWDCGENLAFQAGWSMFQAGDAVETLTTGGFDDNGNFFYVQMTVPFGDAN